MSAWLTSVPVKEVETGDTLLAAGKARVVDFVSRNRSIARWSVTFVDGTVANFMPATTVIRFGGAR